LARTGVKPRPWGMVQKNDVGVEEEERLGERELVSEYHWRLHALPYFCPGVSVNASKPSE
jgi:hypothetical protein